jgi:hypothetical protein
MNARDEKRREEKSEEKRREEKRREKKRREDSTYLVSPLISKGQMLNYTLLGWDGLSTRSGLFRIFRSSDYTFLIHFRYKITD